MLLIVIVIVITGQNPQILTSIDVHPYIESVLSQRLVDLLYQGLSVPLVGQHDVLTHH